LRGSASGALTAAINCAACLAPLSGSFGGAGIVDGAPVHVDVAVERGQAGSMRALIRRADWKALTWTATSRRRRARRKLADSCACQIDNSPLCAVARHEWRGSLTGPMLLHPEQGALTCSFARRPESCAGPFMETPSWP